MAVCVFITVFKTARKQSLTGSKESSACPPIAFLQMVFSPQETQIETCVLWDYHQSCNETSFASSVFYVNSEGWWQWLARLQKIWGSSLTAFTKINNGTVTTVTNGNHLKRQQNQLLKRCQQTTYDVQNIFMSPCIVIDCFLNNQKDALIFQIYSVIKLYMFRASSLPIIRSLLLYIRH